MYVCECVLRSSSFAFCLDPVCSTTLPFSAIAWRGNRAPTSSSSSFSSFLFFFSSIIFRSSRSVFRRPARDRESPSRLRSTVRVSRCDLVLSYVTNITKYIAYWQHCFHVSRLCRDTPSFSFCFSLSLSLSLSLSFSCTNLRVFALGTRTKKSPMYLPCCFAQDVARRRCRAPSCLVYLSSSAKERREPPSSYCSSYRTNVACHAGSTLIARRLSSRSVEDDSRCIVAVQGRG